MRDMWVSYAHGEEAKDESGQVTGVKPPLRIVEEHWPKGCWRKSGQVTFLSLLIDLITSLMILSRHVRHGKGIERYQSTSPDESATSTSNRMC